MRKGHRREGRGLGRRGGGLEGKGIREEGRGERNEFTSFLSLLFSEDNASGNTNLGDVNERTGVVPNLHLLR